MIRELNLQRGLKFCSIWNPINRRCSVWLKRSENTDQFGSMQAQTPAAWNDSLQLQTEADWRPLSLWSSEWITPIMAIFLITFIKLQLYGSVAGISGCAQRNICESAECSRLFYFWVAVLGWRACPFSDLFFKSISHCSISWVCSDMQGIVAPAEGGGVLWRGGIGILTFEKREVCWVHCSDFGALSICDALSKEARKRAAEMSQNSYTNDWKRPCRCMLEFFILRHGLYSNCRAKGLDILKNDEVTCMYAQRVSAALNFLFY